MAKYLIVGATSGIGNAVTKQLAQHHELIGFARTKKNLEGLDIEFHSLDITSENTQFPSIEGLDGLVYLPGSINLKPFNRLTRNDFLSDFQINLLGAVNVIQAYLPQLKKSDKASIVLMSTVAVQKGMPFHASVAAAKGAVEGLTHALAAEFAPKIRVNAVAPSLTDTPMASGLLNTDAKIESSKERHPLKQIGSAEKLAQAIAFLLEEDSSWTTGQILHVDGGLSVI